MAVDTTPSAGGFAVLRKISITWRFILLLALVTLFIAAVVLTFYMGMQAELGHTISSAQNILMEGQREKLAIASNSLAEAIGAAVKNERDPAKRLEIIRAMVDTFRFEQDKSGYLGLRRLLWKPPVQKICDGCPYQVDHGDEGGHVSVASGPRPGCLEETIESFQPCI